MHSLLAGLLICVALMLHSGGADNHASFLRERGAFIGEFSSLNYSRLIYGTAYAVAEFVFFIKNFTYIGGGNDTYFWLCTDILNTPNDVRVVHPHSDSNLDLPLGLYEGEDIFLRLPMDVINIMKFKYLRVTSKTKMDQIFSHIFLKRNLNIPKKRIISEFTTKDHRLRSGRIVILDSKTFYIPHLHYNGTAPAAYFWVGKGKKPDVHGKMIPNELNETTPLKAYSGEDITLVLPGNLSVYNIDYLSVWCLESNTSFGEVRLPKGIYVPPALGQTKIMTSYTHAPDFSNCIEVLGRRVQVEWEPLNHTVLFRVSARISYHKYIGSSMTPTDAVIVGYNKNTEKFLTAKYAVGCGDSRTPCTSKTFTKQTDVEFISGNRENGVISVTYKQYFQRSHNRYPILITKMYIFTMNNTLNDDFGNDVTVSFEGTSFTTLRLDLNSKGDHKCSNPLINLPYKPKLKAWPSMRISGVNEFTVRIGPSGGDRGYSGITGLPSWSIAWYINEMLIPEITVERGKKYTFFVEGGNNINNPARYHPFYITDSPLGGLGQRTPSDLQQERVFAGVAFDSDNPYPTAIGRECTYVHNGIDQSDKAETFKEFFSTLKLECKEGNPAILEWLVEKDTPDLVYYQSYQYEKLGWKIIVIHPANTDTIKINIINIIIVLVLILILPYCIFRRFCKYCKLRVLKYKYKPLIK